jgi:hypothetical protein
MRMKNLFSGINIRGLNRICPEVKYNKELLIKKREIFPQMLGIYKTQKKIDF